MEPDVHELLAAVADEPSPAFLSALEARLADIDLGRPDAATAAAAPAIEVPLAATSMPAGRGRWTGPRFVAVLAVAAPVFVAVLYGAAVLRPHRGVELPATATTEPSVAVVTTAPSETFSAIAGLYVGSTGGSGELVIFPDGLARFTAPNTVACPTCSNATAPPGTIEITLTSLARTANRGYVASGTITAESDAAWAAEIGTTPSEKPIGSSADLTVSPLGQLSLSFLPPDDVLIRAPS